ncbi:uncharacterized protein LOC114841042 [Diachasma alloeum]|uniref:uncharacterized protein LOC114841042 n=1 Tax=Diachasma alloeum TaxID=454923 RepID=UPI0007383C56|nr:uncharacterized protein LOC114841042 [Diachasma alloeum]XP_028982093.1 uncharacterized protein LOC114841042 [Diachasma alloeum]
MADYYSEEENKEEKTSNDDNEENGSDAGGSGGSDNSRRTPPLEVQRGNPGEMGQNKNRVPPNDDTPQRIQQQPPLLVNDGGQRNDSLHEMRQLLINLDRKVDNIKTTVNDSNERLRAYISTHGFENEPKMVPEPFNTLHDLLEFDKTLKADEESCRRFTYQVWKVGGKTLQKHAANVMTRLISNELAKRCTWTGLHGTQKIEGMKFSEIIISALANTWKNETEDEVKERIKDWLRRPGDRLRRGRKHQERP